MTNHKTNSGVLFNLDCLDFMPSIPDKSIDMILCDLPYTFKGKNRVTSNTWDLPIDDNLLWKQYLRIIKDNGAIVLTASNPFASFLIFNHIQYFKYDWVWEKDNGSNFVHVKTQPFRVHEFVCVFGKSPTTYNKLGNNMNYNPQFIFKEPYIRKICNDKFVSNLSGNTKRINLNNLDGKRFPRSVQKFNRDITGLHPTQKPVLLFEYLIKTYTNEGNVILDNCSGSGTTVIASINTNRKYICIEKDKGYYDLSVNRINHRLEYGTDTYKKPKFK